MEAEAAEGWAGEAEVATPPVLLVLLLLLLLTLLLQMQLPRLLLPSHFLH